MISRVLYIAFRIIIPLLILGAGVGGFVFLVSLKKDPPRLAPEQAVPLVETVEVEEHGGELTIKLDGSVVPFREIPLSAEVAGRITYKSPHCRAGKFVQKDEVLFRINEQEYQLAVDRLTHEEEQARASINELKVQIESAQALVKVATDELALRTRELERVQRLRLRTRLPIRTSTSPSKTNSSHAALWSLSRIRCDWNSRVKSGWNLHWHLSARSSRRRSSTSLEPKSKRRRVA